MKYRCFAALALAMLLPGCAAAPDLTPVWQRDLPASGVHIELANAALLSDADVYYAATREELYVHNVSVLPAVKADGQPVVTFYGAEAQDIDLVYLEDIGDVYVDYDRVKPQFVNAAQVLGGPYAAAWIVGITQHHGRTLGIGKGFLQRLEVHLV